LSHWACCWELLALTLLLLPCCRRVLPCVIDVGTDNEALQNLDLYMGLHQPRITDQDLYRDIVDEVRRPLRCWWAQV